MSNFHHIHSALLHDADDDSTVTMLELAMEHTSSTTAFRTLSSTEPTTGLSDEGPERSAVVEPQVEDATLGRVDRFEIIRKLGSGGMGTVYEAFDEKLQRRVALKFLRGDYASPRSERRFFREAQGIARIAHPNVVA